MCEASEEPDESKLLTKVFQSYAGIHASALNNSTKLIHVVKEILSEHFTIVE